MILDRQASKAADGEDHKPFMRKLNEFGFWEGVTLSIFLACFLSFWRIFDVPVFWPLLLAYFGWTIVVVVGKQRAHMEKWGYGLGDFFKSGGRGGRGG